MEQLNKIILRGRVGSVARKQVNDRIMINFALCVDEVFKNDDGENCITTQWFNVVATEGSEMSFDLLHSIEKYDELEVIGRIQQERYVSDDNVERTTSKIIANSIAILSKETV